MSDSAYSMLEILKHRGIEELNQWVRDGVREDLHLDFKRKSKSSSPVLSDDDKRNFARALSGFANSDSGLVIWGIGAPGSGKAERTKHPITSVKAYAENLDSMISRMVSPAVLKVENHVIFEDEAVDLGYVITYVPRSDRAPHRAECEGLKQYYKRYGESFKIAEHYELEYMFGRRQRPNLGIIWSVEIDEVSTSSVTGRIRLGVSNDGKAIGRYVCLRLRYDPKGPYPLVSEDHSDLIHYSIPSKASRGVKVVLTARALLGLVIYPNDYNYFFSFGFDISKDALKRSRLSKLLINYDLFGQDFLGKTQENFPILGRKIAEKVRRKLSVPSSSGNT